MDQAVCYQLLHIRYSQKSSTCTVLIQLPADFHQTKCKNCGNNNPISCSFIGIYIYTFFCKFIISKLIFLSNAADKIELWRHNLRVAILVLVSNEKKKRSSSWWRVLGTKYFVTRWKVCEHYIEERFSCSLKVVLLVEDFFQHNLRSLVLQYHFDVFCDLHQEMF